MDDRADIPDEMRGLYPKYRVFEEGDGDPNLSDISAVMAGLPVLREVKEDCFVIKFSDPFAPDALRAYARACKAQYPQLAEDLESVFRGRKPAD